MATQEGNRDTSDKNSKPLTTALTQIERTHGKGAIMWMGGDGMRVEIESISTGAINLDAAIGIDVTENWGSTVGATPRCQHLPGIGEGTQPIVEINGAIECVDQVEISI